MDHSLITIQQALDSIATVANWTVIGVLTSVGAFAMALVQLVKDLTPLRRWFQRWWVRGWLAEQLRRFNNSARATDLPGQLPSFGQIHETLIELATGGDAPAFYDLPAEQLVAQVNAAAQIVLDNPRKYLGLLAVLGEGNSPDDIAALVSAPDGKKLADEVLAARNRVGHRIQRNLDGMQISLSNRWKFIMQSAGIALSTAIIEAGVVATAGLDPRTLTIGLAIGLAGGYVAPITRDLVAALQTLRKG